MLFQNEIGNHADRTVTIATPGGSPLWEGREHRTGKQCNDCRFHGFSPSKMNMQKMRADIAPVTVARKYSKSGATSVGQLTNAWRPQKLGAMSSGTGAALKPPGMARPMAERPGRPGVADASAWAEVIDFLVRRDQRIDRPVDAVQRPAFKDSVGDVVPS
jgi:hypothetical protein